MSGPTTVRVHNDALVGAVLGRVVGMLAARAQCPIDRLDDALLLTDAVSAHAGKRHGMIKRTKKQIRQLRGTRILFKTDGDNIKKYFLPNA